MLREEITKAVRSLLGWEWKQYGDAVCFLTITYRNNENDVVEERYVLLIVAIKISSDSYSVFWLVMRTDSSVIISRLLHAMTTPWVAILRWLESLFSQVIFRIFCCFNSDVISLEINPKIPPKVTFIKQFKDGSQAFALPDPESVVPYELRALLKCFIEELWGKCQQYPLCQQVWRHRYNIVSSDDSRTQATVPWLLLEHIEAATSPLQDAALLSKFPCLDPDKLEIDELYKLAREFSNKDHGIVFKQPGLMV